MWCTNRMNGATADYSLPTFGIQNQIEASLGQPHADWNSSHARIPAGMDMSAAIAFFQGQFLPAVTYSTIQHLQCSLPTLPEHLPGHLLAGQ